MKNNNPEPPASFSAFWPLMFISLTIITFLGWQVSIGVRQYLSGVRFAEQQELMAAQAARVESNFQALMMDVLALARSNPDVQAVVNNYNIRFTPPAGIPSGAPSDSGKMPESPSPTVPVP